VNGSGQIGSSLVTDGWTNVGAKVLNKGQIIQIKGLKEIQLRGERKATGQPANFVVREDVTPNSDGSATIKIDPEIHFGTDTIVKPEVVDLQGFDLATLDHSAFQTVKGTLADNAPITVLGRAVGPSVPNEGEEKLYRQGFFYNPDALAYVHALPKKHLDADCFCPMSCPEMGVAIRYCVESDEDPGLETRWLGIKYGVEVVSPEFATRYIGEEIDPSML